MSGARSAASWRTVTHSSTNATKLTKENTVSKKGRKKRGRKKNAANHGKRPNS
ncbi:MAG: hypothetical protein M3186_10260 [Actinomycetota bacterium]|nr:hypothetical protein [Actinomycetota bacterium]